MRKKTLCITSIFEDDPKSKFEFFFAYLHEYMGKKGRDVIRASVKKYNVETKMFDCYYRYDAQRQKYILYEEKIKPTICQYRTNTNTYKFLDIARNYKVINNEMLVILSLDKFTTYSRFREYMPLTYTLGEVIYKSQSAGQSIEEWIKSKFPTEFVILKPRYGSLGVGVQKIHVEKLKEYVEQYLANANDNNMYQEKKNILIQEFVDSSGGIPGLVSGIHDVRTVVFGDRIGYFAVRTAKEGDFRCNVSQGGTSHNILPEYMPSVYVEQIKDIIKKVNEFTYSTTGIYTIDFFVDKTGKLNIIELNSNPGHMTLFEDEKFMQIHAEGVYYVCEKIYKSKK